MDVTTRLAIIADLPALAALIGELIVSHDLAVTPLAQREAAVRHVLADERAFCIVAVADSAVVGCVFVHETFSTWANSHCGYLEDYAVTAALRSQGIGALLLDHIRRLAAERGWARIDLDATRASRQAAFYEREGFHDTGSTRYRLDR